MRANARHESKLADMSKDLNFYNGGQGGELNSNPELWTLESTILIKGHHFVPPQNKTFCQ